LLSREQPGTKERNCTIGLYQIELCCQGNSQEQNGGFVTFSLNQIELCWQGNSQEQKGGIVTFSLNQIELGCEENSHDQGEKLLPSVSVR
jgi:hypothetical protein